MEILSNHHKIYGELKKENIVSDNNSINIQLHEENEKGEKNNYKELQNKLGELIRFRKAATYKITEGEYRFFIQDLAAKSLLVDFGIGAIGIDS